MSYNKAVDQVIFGRTYTIPPTRLEEVTDENLIKMYYTKINNKFITIKQVSELSGNPYKNVLYRLKKLKEAGAIGNRRYQRPPFEMDSESELESALSDLNNVVKHVELSSKHKSMVIEILYKVIK